MKNYHYYLKQEIFSHRLEGKRFHGFRWHPEQPLKLYILGDSWQSLHRSLLQADFLSLDYVQVRSFVWDTYAARLPTPKDTASVAVVDGSKHPVIGGAVANYLRSLAHYALPHAEHSASNGVFYA